MMAASPALPIFPSFCPLRGSQPDSPSPAATSEEEDKEQSAGSGERRMGLPRCSDESRL